MYPTEEPENAEERHPAAPPISQPRPRDWRSRLRDALAGLKGRAQSWDEGNRASSFVPAVEKVFIDARRHAFVLAAPVLRTVAGLAVLAVGLELLLLLLFASITAVWARLRLKTGFRRSVSIAGSVAVVLVVVDVLSWPLLGAVLLLGWLAEDVADWYSDRLVVTDKRLYRRHGVVTRHSPSISLTAIAYIDAAVPPLGGLLGYGTLGLDSVAQRDAPLSRFDFIHDVVPISHEILRLRTQAMPKFPQQPY